MKPNIKRPRTTSIGCRYIALAGFFVGIFTNASVLAQQPVESGAGKICGVLRNFQGETQIFDYTRTQLGDARFGAKLHCGDWISVDHGRAVIQHANGAAILVSENSFVQILDPQSGTNLEHAHLALYRGEFLIEAGKGESRVITPNALARVEKGGAYVLYSSTSEESQIVGLGGKATLANRFFSDKTMQANLAYMVTFSNPLERLIPEQGRLVNAKELNARLAAIGVDPGIMASVERTVKGASKVRMPVSLASTVREESPESAVRHYSTTASPAVQRLSRAPASVHARPSPVAHKKLAKPDFALKRQAEEENDRKKLIQSLSMMRPDEG